MNKETFDIRIIELDKLRKVLNEDSKSRGRRFIVEVNGNNLIGTVLFCRQRGLEGWGSPSKIWYTFQFDNPLVKKAKNYKLLRYNILREMLKENRHMNLASLRKPK